MVLMAPGVQRDAGPAEPVGRLVHAEPAGGDDEVGRVVEQRLEHGRHFARVVLAVGVEGDHVAGAVGGGQLVAQAQGGALAQVHRAARR